MADISAEEQLGFARQNSSTKVHVCCRAKAFRGWSCLLTVRWGTPEWKAPSVSGGGVRPALCRWDFTHPDCDRPVVVGLLAAPAESNPREVGTRPCAGCGWFSLSG